MIDAKLDALAGMDTTGMAERWGMNRQGEEMHEVERMELFE